MIATLQGILSDKQTTSVIVEVGGLGYEVFVPLTTLWKLPDVGQSVTLYTQLIIREDAHTLYGFKQLVDKQFFVQLIRVNGIGPKVALAILSGLTVDECHQAIISQNTQAFIAVPGIGKKTAERLMIELQDKVPKLLTMSALPRRCQQEALEALLSLGYTAKEAQKAIASVPDAGENSEFLIKRALQGLANL